MIPALIVCMLDCPLECERIANLRRFLASPPAGASGTGFWVWEPPYKDEERGLAACGVHSYFITLLAEIVDTWGNYL